VEVELVVRLVLAASYGEVPADAGHRRPRESAAHSGSINNETSVYRIEFPSFAIRGVNGNTEGPTSGYLTICVQAHEGIAVR
jgi:hypothetical protein